jgi:hypothetical protein
MNRERLLHKTAPLPRRRGRTKGRLCSLHAFSYHVSFVMRRSEKSFGSERSVYRAHNDLFVTFILLLFDEYFKIKFVD